MALISTVATQATVQAQESPSHSVAANSAIALPAGLDTETREKLIPILTRARDRGLPVNALTSKVAEGLLRGVASPRIVSAVQALEERLTTAYMALAPAQEPDIIAGADALAAGVKVNVLRSIRRSQPRSSVAVPLAVLAQLVSQGVSPNKATQIILKLIERGATPQQLLALRKAVNDDILAGEPAPRALDERAASVFAALSRMEGLGAATTTTTLMEQAGGASIQNGKKK
jgi:hypothetical protein